MPQTWQTRLTEEHAQLQKKLKDLRHFIRHGAEYKALEAKDQELLQEQCKAMSLYEGVLSERIYRLPR